MTFLVVDNSPVMRQIVVNSLKHLGYDSVLETERGKEALLMLEENQVDLIITDWDRPGMDGIALTRYVRNQSELQDTPILMATTRSLEEDVIKAISTGISDYLVKPFDPRVMQAKVLDLLESNEVEH